MNENYLGMLLSITTIALSIAVTVLNSNLNKRKAKLCTVLYDSFNDVESCKEKSFDEILEQIKKLKGIK